MNLNDLPERERERERDVTIPALHLWPALIHGLVIEPSLSLAFLKFPFILIKSPSLLTFLCSIWYQCTSFKGKGDTSIM